MAWDRATVERLGFVGFVSFADLRAGKLMDVTENACAYVVFRTGSKRPSFLAISTGGWFQGRDPSVDLRMLKSKWIDGCPVLYIGKADRLRRRLKQFSDFGLGRNVGHWGGRYLWHLADSAELLVAWKRCAPDETAADLETRLLHQFVADYGALPFANLRA